MMAHGWQRWFGSFALSLVACGPPAAVGALSPKQQAVRVETSDPPPGARLVGPIQGSDGPDCAILEPSGTKQGALAALRKTAADRGVDFVKVTSVTQPFSDHTCVHKRYKIDGIGYAVAAPQPALAAPQPAPAAPQPALACTPACAAGYVCRAGACEAECDPACGPAQYCRFDRVCAPVPTAPTAPPVTPAPLSAP